ncbi:hypothetical protein [Persephonella sp.]
MKNVNNILDKLIEKLNEEKDLLIKTIEDASYTENLLAVIEEKRDLLAKLSQFKKEDLEKYKDKLITIESLSKRNMTIAVSNVQFIEEIFSTLFDETKKYDQSGTVSQEQKGLFNKKI